MFSGVLESAYGLPPPDAPPIVPSRSATRKSRERKIEVKSGDGSSQQRKLSRAQSLRSFVAQFRGSKEGKKSSSGSRTTSSTYDDDSSQADTGSETCTPIQEECEDLDETSAKQHDSRDLVHAQLNELTIHDDGNATQHQRGVSFHVTWMTADVPRLAKEVYEKTIPDVHLSLFAYWIRERPENYEVAKKHIRELALDQVRAFYSSHTYFRSTDITYRVTTSLGLATCTCASCSKTLSRCVQSGFPTRKMSHFAQKNSIRIRWLPQSHHNPIRRPVRSRRMVQLLNSHQPSRLRSTET